MELNIYSSEKFDRSKWRYVILTFVMVLVIGLCAYYRNWTGIILMFVILGGYIYMGFVNFKEIKLKITEDGLFLGDKIIPWTSMVGYVIEIDKNTQEIKNIVFLSERNHSIHTIVDSKEHIAGFLTQLDKFLPMMSEYKQTTREKLIRVLKL